jgi:hypothetical protein
MAGEAMAGEAMEDEAMEDEAIGDAAMEGWKSRAVASSIPMGCTYDAGRRRAMRRPR